MKNMIIGLVVVLLLLIALSGYTYYIKFYEPISKDDTSVADAIDPIWGRISNQGFENEKTRGAFFFAGPPNNNESLYTRHPVSDMWDWNDSGDVEVIFTEMEEAEVNVVKLSWWGYADAIKYSPTKYTRQIHTDTFAAAEKHNMLVAPVIEVGPHFKFWEEFPNDTTTMEFLIEEYLNYHGNEQNWLEIYNKNGESRKVIWLIETIHGSEIEGSIFASTFDTVATRVYQKTGHKIGFVIDPTPLPADSTAYYGPDCEQLKTKESILAINPFNVTSDSGTEIEKLSNAKQIFAEWGACSIPFMTNVIPGFDDHIVRSLSDIYGDNDEWREAVKGLSLEYETAGITLDIWNGFTEGYVFTPTREMGDANYQLAKSTFEELVGSDNLNSNENNTTSSEQCESIDSNSDETLTIIDFKAFVMVYGETCTVNEDESTVCGSQDVNGDGKVNIIDFSSFVKRYRKDSCSL